MAACTAEEPEGIDGHLAHFRLAGRGRLAQGLDGVGVVELAIHAGPPAWPGWRRRRSGSVSDTCGSSARASGTSGSTALPALGLGLERPERPQRQGDVLRQLGVLIGLVELVREQVRQLAEQHRVAADLGVVLDQAGQLESQIASWPSETEAGGRTPSRRARRRPACRTSSQTMITTTTTTAGITKSCTTNPADGGSTGGRSGKRRRLVLGLTAWIRSNGSLGWSCTVGGLVGGGRLDRRNLNQFQEIESSAT